MVFRCANSHHYFIGNPALNLTAKMVSGVAEKTPLTLLNEQGLSPMQAAGVCY
jgi:hypothetical protein|tara:strand:- start:116 stop:274 length:159 start_codon:yes stop_codon:yes gene_type:complete